MKLIMNLRKLSLMAHFVFSEILMLTIYWKHCVSGVCDVDIYTKIKYTCTVKVGPSYIAMYIVFHS